MISAAGFVASLGVNAHPNSHFAPYQDLVKLEAGLKYLGINTIRTTAIAWKAPSDTLAAHGVKFDFVVPNNYISTTGSVDLQATIVYLNWFQNHHPGAITSIEGANEFNFWPVTYNGLTGSAGAAALQQGLFAGVNNTASLADVPVYNLTMGLSPGQGASAYASLGDLSTAADYGNIHLYFNGRPSSQSWDTLASISQASTRGLPHAVVTEVGYSSAYNDASNRSVSEIDQAKLTLNMLMLAAKKGVDRTFLYHLADQEPDPNHSQYELGLGLFRSDWSAKPAALALHNLNTVLTDEAAPLTAGGAVNYTLSGMPTTAQDVLFQESDHIYDLVLWNDVDVWNETTRSENVIAPKAVTVQFDHAYARVKVYDPMLGTTAVLDAGAADSVTVVLTDHPLVIELKDEIAAAAPPVVAPTLPLPVPLSGPVEPPGASAISSGYVTSETGSAAARVYRLYQAALGREPDAAGLAGWAAKINQGAGLETVATGFLGSQEFVGRFGAGTDSQFVTLLYNNVLHRSPDAAGLADWLSYLGKGHSRAEAVVGFSESAENVDNTAPSIERGIWVTDANAAPLARLYDTVLDRLPDERGLGLWAAAMQSGKSLTQVADGFVASPEFQATYGALSDIQFVERLYLNVLGRPGEQSGVDAWSKALAAGHSRAEVVVGFSESPEHVSLIAPYVDHGVVFG